MKASILFFTALIFVTGCSKVADSVINNQIPSTSNQGEFILYTIAQGAQYCNQRTLKPMETSELKFVAQFDSSAIYQTQKPENQYDINKLYGFSDNNTADHHLYSARLGWRWSDGALRLFAYVYNAGVVSSKELTTIPIGAEVNCSIAVKGDTYVFSANEITRTLPRSSTTEQGKGYQLYPYFGGDETASHEVRIWIKTIQ